MTVETSRRGFLKGASAAALTVGFLPSGALAAAGAAAAPAALNPFVSIGTDGTVTVISKHFDSGQGAATGLATLVAEELDADWAQVSVAFASADAKRYNNLLFGSQGTGGSTAMANSWLQYRQAGAAARAMLVAAAARRWGVAPEAVAVEAGVLSAGENRASFADLVAEAARESAPAQPALKPREAYRLIGDPTLARKDSAAKTDGSARFASDVKIEGMVHAAILRAPKFGARLVSFDAAAAREMPGFVAAHALGDGSGVAVFGRSTWTAIQARGAVTAEWDLSEAETRSTGAMMADHLAALDQPRYLAREGSDFAATGAAIAEADKVVEAEFRFPLLAHAPMEPLTCVIAPSERGVRLIDGCQFPGIAHPTLAAVLGLSLSEVEVETVWAGGSFGRRATPSADYQTEAALAFLALGGETPVKLVWTREDDIRGGAYRPMAAHRARVGLRGGRVVGWDHRVAVKSILKGTPFEAALVEDGVDKTSVEGLADTPYAIAGMSVGLTDTETPLPVLWWRAVGHTHTAFAMETLMDMAAQAAGRDPVAFRLSMLAGEGEDHRRLAGVLRLATEKAGWDEALPAGRGRGVAVHKSFGSYVALVAEVSTEGETGGEAVRIERIVCAVDCGTAINPDVVAAQMEGGIGYGLGAAMRNRITLRDGAVEQSNFPDYAPLRMADIGVIETHIVPSQAKPTGVGEPGTPPAAPAVANAIFAATGKRITSLPMTAAGVRFA